MDVVGDIEIVVIGIVQYCWVDVDLYVLVFLLMVGEGLVDGDY